MRHGHADAEIRNQLAKHQSPAAQWTNEQVFQRSFFPLAHNRHGCGKGRADLQDDPDHAGNVKVRAPHRRVVKHLRPNIDRARRGAGFVAEAIRPIESEPQRALC